MDVVYGKLTVFLTIIIPPSGVSAPAADMFEIRLLGKGCHGAMPHKGADAINAGAHLLLALQTITAREISLNDPHAITIASFQAGEAANVMPDRAVLKGSVRSFDGQLQQFIRQRIRVISTATAKTFRVKATLKWLNGCPTLINKPDLVKKAGEILPLQHPAVVFSEEALPYGAAVYAGFAMAFC